MRNVNVKLVQVPVAKNVPVLLHQLLEFKYLNLDSTQVDKTCTNQLQQCHMPGEGVNHAIKCSELKLEKVYSYRSIGDTKRPIV